MNLEDERPLTELIDELLDGESRGAGRRIDAICGEVDDQAEPGSE